MMSLQTSASVVEVVQHLPPLLTPHTMARTALAMAERMGVHYVPVVSERGEPLGVVCRCDLMAANWLGELADCIHGPALTISSAASLEQAAQLLVQNGVGCLPIVDDSEVVGVVTREDLLRLHAIDLSQAPRCARCGTAWHVHASQTSDEPLCRRCRGSDSDVGDDPDWLEFGDGD
jgi:CBS domain-containing protein